MAGRGARHARSVVAAESAAIAGPQHAPANTQEHPTSEAHARLEPTLIPMLRPLCPACQGRMMLTCIEPGYDSPDLRILECSKFGHVYTAPAEDPVKLVR